MDIHAPEHPISSFKDFALHIVIVTIGILIALDLEGARESIHNHRLVREARQNFRAELTQDQTYAADEVAHTSAVERNLKGLLHDLPVLAHDHPEQINQRLAALENPYFFFSSNSWQSALSTGAVAHMNTEDVSAFANASEVIKVYGSIQAQTLAAQINTTAFFAAHPHPTPEQIEAGTERLVIFIYDQHAMVHVGLQLKESMHTALSAASR